MEVKVTKNRAPRSQINKKGRLIIRNLSFKATEDAVKNWFDRYGEIQDVKLLKKADGTLVGCGFVQFKTMFNAAKAIKECNAKPFLGRPIAVDWAIPKQKYAVQNKESDTAPEAGIEELAKTEEPSSDNEEDENEEQSIEEDDKSAGSRSNEDQEENFDSNEEEDGSDSQTGEEKNWKGQNVEIEKKSDVGEGKTVFVRNLDFSTAQDSLKNYMEKFGAVHYALLCMDKVMERPRGTGFIKFKDAESAQKCIEESQNSLLHLDGRQIDAVLAVTRQDLDKQKLENKKEQKDNRNLYLGREGFIRPGTLAAQGVSPTDMAKRQQNELWKKQMLRNLHMYISRERLCVHNLPLKMTDKQLSRLFLKHSSKEAKITEARIMRDLKSAGTGKVFPSKGYGFVTFTKHEDALLALRNINNNPTIFTNDRRPIVEFSIENRAAVKAKMQRIQKSAENVKKNLKVVTPKVKKIVVEGLPKPEFSGAAADPKIKTLPTHAGPKIRHRKRPAQPGMEGSQTKKPKISRKMFKNPANRKASMKKNSTKEPNSKKKVPAKKSGGGQERATTSKPQPHTSTNSSQQKKKWFDS